ncbi:MAG: hypothetical protein AB8B85_10370 [Paracoccaceae bacterium]
MQSSFLVHSHIPKTGGSALNQRFLFPRLGEDRVQMLYRYVFEAAHRLPMRHITPSMRCYGATGHVPYGYFERVYPAAIYVSVFREPVDRMLSFLNFALATPGHKLHERIGLAMAGRAAEDPDAFAMAVLQEPRLAVVHSNVQTRLACGCARLADTRIDALHLEIAESNLKQNNYLFGDQTDLSSFVEDMKARFPLHGRSDSICEVDAKTEKRLPKLLTSDMLRPRTLAALENANHFDLGLYDRITKRTANLAAA